MDEQQYYTIILRHDTSTLWMTNDPILRLGEYGVEDDTHKVKRGDGESKWSELSYEDFGLTYIVTFENLHGDLEQNEALVDEFNKKISKSVFEDVNNKVVASLKLTNEEDGEICRITRLTKDIETLGTVQNVVRIYSSDNSIQGYWSITDDGAKVLDLVSRSAISDYEPNHTYFKDQICYYGNKLYRAYKDLVAGATFNEKDWVLLTSLYSSDIKYDNLLSGLDSDNVKDALDELKRRDDRKVSKSTEERVVYGTDSTGQQTVIPIDDLRKVDTVNHKKADLSKNVQIDASDINYSDANPENGTVRQILDSKVDKVFAGQGARIVRDVQFEYDETNGHIKLIEDKVSPEDGSSAKEEREIDVVAEKELTTAVSNINNRIDEEVETLNTTITNKETVIYSKIQAEHDEINNRVDTEVSKLNNRIDNEINTTNERIDTEVETLNNTITSTSQTINDRIDDEVNTLNETINEKEENLQGQIDTNKSELNRVETESKTRDTELGSRVSEEVKTLNTRIDNEVNTLNTTINDKETSMTEHVADEVNILNTRIDEEVKTLNTTVNDKETAMDNKKIDKDIAETIVTAIEVSSHDSQPTIKVTNKNTDTKTPNVDYVHFGTKGKIKTEMEDADHIVIDSTDIDTENQQQNARLTNAEERLNAHDTQIASLLEHDVNHDKALAQHSNQIAMHETRLTTAEDNIRTLQQDLETESTARQTADDALSSRITTNAVNITTKADKTFANETDNKVVGNIEYGEPYGDELLKINKTLVSPIDGSHSVTGFKIHSSDNTVVATPIMENDEFVGIDIATNLDTDVNYFVTSEILNTTIPSDNTISLDSLTATDKTTVELQDIISDSEGTWARVKSIDTEANTCVAVTFHKHAQAVWGTVKGDINSQADLIDKLAEKFSIPGSGAMQSYVGGDTIDYTLTGLITEIDNEEYLSELSVESIAYNFKEGTGNGHRLMYLKQREEDINNCDIMFRKDTDDYGNKYIVPRVCAENIYFNPQNSGLSSNKLSAAIRELRTLAVADNENTKNALQNTETQLNNTINEKETALNKAITDLNADLLNQIQIVRDEKLSQVNGVTNSIYGINENGQQVTFSTSIFGNVDSVNGIVAKNKDIVITGKDIDMSSDDDKKLTDVIKLLNDTLDTIKTELQNQFIVYKPDTIFKLGTVVTNMFTTFVRDDGIMLMAKVLKSFTADTTQDSSYESFMKDVELGNLKLVGIPEQQGNV